MIFTRFNDTQWAVTSEENEKIIRDFLSATGAKSIHIKMPDGSIVRAWIDLVDVLNLMYLSGTFQEMRAEKAAQDAAIKFIKEHAND